MSDAEHILNQIYENTEEVEAALKEFGFEFCYGGSLSGKELKALQKAGLSLDDNDESDWVSDLYPWNISMYSYRDGVTIVIVESKSKTEYFIADDPKIWEGKLRKLWGPEEAIQKASAATLAHRKKRAELEIKARMPAAAQVKHGFLYTHLSSRGGSVFIISCSMKKADKLYFAFISDTDEWTGVRKLLNVPMKQQEVIDEDYVGEFLLGLPEGNWNQTDLLNYGKMYKHGNALQLISLRQLGEMGYEIGKSVYTVPYKKNPDGTLTWVGDAGEPQEEYSYAVDPPESIRDAHDKTWELTDYSEDAWGVTLLDVDNYPEYFND